MKHFMSLCQEIINIDCKCNELVALGNMAADLLFDDDGALTSCKKFEKLYGPILRKSVTYLLTY